MEHERAARLGLYRDRVNRKQLVQLTDTSSLILLAVFAVLLTVVFYAPTNNWRWDPSFYYAQLRAPLIDHQLDFRAETIPHNGVRDYTVNGLQPSPWPIGPGLLWAPFFVAAQLYTRLGHGIARPTGFEPVSIAAVSAGSAFYGMLGVLVVYRICRCFTSSSRAVLSAGLGTPGNAASLLHLPSADHGA